MALYEEKLKKTFQQVRKNILEYHYDAEGDPSKILLTKTEDGRFSDLDYEKQNWTGWGPGAHIMRTESLCAMYACPENKAYHDKNLKKDILELLEFFINGHFHSDNWWWNDVGVPTSCGKIMLLLKEELPEDIKAGVIRLFNSTRISRVFNLYSNTSDKNALRSSSTACGATFKAVVDTHIYLAMLDGDPVSSMEKIKQCIGAINDEYMVVNWAEGHGPNGLAEEEQGVKSDYSFLLHENCLVQNTYGTTIIGHMAILLKFWKDTDLKISDDAAWHLVNILLEGYNYTRFRGYSPMMLMGRDVGSEKIKLFSKGVLENFATVCDHLLTRDIPKRAQLEEFCKRMRNPETEPNFEGTKYFWHADYISHNRGGFQFTVHGVSTRLKRPEACLKKNALGMYLGDGCYNLLKKGDEYADVAPCLEWRKVPGVTSNLNVTDEQLNPESEIDTTIDTWRIFGSARGTMDFAGGASDGKTGFFAMDFDHMGIKAKKAWFCFDDAVVCLGANINAEYGAHAFTTLNQCNLKGEVVADGKAVSNSDHILSECGWVWHDNVGYVFLDKAKTVELKNREFIGCWNRVDIDNGTTDEVKKELFMLGIDHGENANNAGYAYGILPEASIDETTEFEKNPTVLIIENSNTCQAVWQESTKQLQAVFYSQSEINVGGFTLKADSPCAVMLKLEGPSYKLWVSRPDHTEGEVGIILDGSIKGDIRIPFEKGFRFNNLGRPCCYDGAKGILPYTNAKGDNIYV